MKVIAIYNSVSVYTQLVNIRIFLLGGHANAHWGIGAEPFDSLRYRHRGLPAERRVTLVDGVELLVFI
jgi:hypothetical protein